MRINPRCPKCSQMMYGPKYERDWGERLRYVCGCGYTMTTPCDDAPPKNLTDLEKHCASKSP